MSRGCSGGRVVGGVCLGGGGGGDALVGACSRWSPVELVDVIDAHGALWPLTPASCLRTGLSEKIGATVRVGTAGSVLPGPLCTGFATDVCTRTVRSPKTKEAGSKRRDKSVGGARTNNNTQSALCQPTRAADPTLLEANISETTWALPAGYKGSKNLSK